MRRLSDGMLLLIVGAALGPLGLNILSTATLSILDPAMPVALVALGMLVGLGISVRRSGDGRVIAAAMVETLLTIAAVSTAVLFIGPWWGTTTTLPFWIVALVLGICAAPSAAASLHAPVDSRSAARRVGDVDGLVSIALGGAALALVREQSIAQAMPVLGQACGVALVIVLAAWLLIRTSSSETEQRVFTAALLLLLGGAADYLSLSALLSGLIGGVFLQLVGELQTPWLGLGVIYLLVRASAKLAGGWAVRHVAPPSASGNLAMSLLAPGILGVAFALNVVRAAGTSAEPMLAVAAVGAIGSDVIASFVRSNEDPESSGDPE
jgi:hypothetical protein